METPPILPPTPPESPVPAPQGSPSDRQWAAITHLSALVGLVVPFGNIVGPLIVWLVKKPEMPSLEPVGKAVLNYQISWSIWGIIAGVIGVVGSCLIVPILLPIGVVIAWLVFTILGGVKASSGETYQYPLCLKFL